MTCRLPSERVIVPSFEAVSPLLAGGVPVARSGGQAVAQAPEQSLLAPTSALNRYRVRPPEFTRIDPRLVFAAPTVAGAPLEVFGGDGAVSALPPPHALRPAKAAVSLLRWRRR